MSSDETTYDVWQPGNTPAEAPGPAPTFSIVVPTLGRESLKRTIASIAGQLRSGDEILVECLVTNDGGNAARQRGIEAATSSHIIFCDDDDVFVPGAIGVMRRFAAEHPRAIGIFRRGFNAGPPQWREPILRAGNVQSQGFLVPNVKGKLGVWGVKSRDPVEQAALEARGVRHWTDVHFVNETAELQGARVIFCDVIVGYARPERNPLRRLRYRLKIRTRVRELLSRRAQRDAGPRPDLPPSRPT